MVKKIELEQKNQELVNDLKRIHAEFNNYRKREEQNKKELYETATKQLIIKLIPILDIFELAIKNTPEGVAKQGMEMIYSQFFTILNEEGVTKTEPLNEKFNPEEHEAIMVEKGKGPETVIEVMQSGYKLKNKIIRHAKVKIRRQ